jgi:uncharacterized protein
MVGQYYGMLAQSGKAEAYVTIRRMARFHPETQHMWRYKMKLRTPAVAAMAWALVSAAFFVVQGVSARGNVGAPVAQSVTNHTIAVGGHGEVDVAPDMATLQVGVQTNGNDAQAALANNATKMSAVIAAIQGFNVPTSHIKTSDLSIWYDSDHNTYVVSHTVTVNLDGTSTVGQVLDAAVAAGANNSWGVTFGLKDDSAARSQALQAAIADARGRANSMATSLGVSITGVGSASETSYSAPQPIVYAAKAAAAPAPSTPVQAGQLTITADVSVVYTFG